jgi:DNA-binding transcriptional regulator LsrR (DeoR family)
LPTRASSSSNPTPTPCLEWVDSAREFAERLGGRNRYLHAPALFASAERLATMLAEPAISTAVDAARAADVALVGIGTARRGSFIAPIQDFELSQSERRQIQASGAAGDLVGRFFDLSGREVPPHGITGAIATGWPGS